MSQSVDEKLKELSAALTAAEREKAEAYLGSDWVRVWELTNKEIPELLNEIKFLTESGCILDKAAVISRTQVTPPLDFQELHIELLESKNFIINRWLLRQPKHIKRVKISIVYSSEQRSIIERSLLDHVIFYETRRSQPVRVADLLDSAWTSEAMNETDADNTAENARQGINDLRLIIQERARLGRA